MANRVAPTPTDADNFYGSFTPAARSVWRSVRRFHVGTGHAEPTSDAGYTTAGSPLFAAITDQSLVCRGESIYAGLGVPRLKIKLKLFAGISTISASTNPDE